MSVGSWPVGRRQPADVAPFSVLPLLCRHLPVGICSIRRNVLTESAAPIDI